jgi:hypothetical protein
MHVSSRDSPQSLEFWVDCRQPGHNPDFRVLSAPEVCSSLDSDFFRNLDKEGTFSQINRTQRRVVQERPLERARLSSYVINLSPATWANECGPRR